MDFEFNEEQRMMQQAARRFLTKECSSAFVREMEQDPKGHSTDLWQRMTELGWMGLPFPETYGGVEGTFLDLAVLLSEMGFVCLPGPFFSSIVLAGSTILDAGNESQRRAILPQLANGSQIATLAWTGTSATYAPEGISLKAEVSGDAYILTGTKLFVADAHVAHIIVCAVRTNVNEPARPEEGISLLWVDSQSSGITIEPLQTIAGDKQCAVHFQRVKVPRTNLLGEQDKGWPVLQRVLHKAAVAKCAEMVGGAERVIELVMLQARERVQFGKPIGSFQAVQHHCANILTYFETSKFMTFDAAWRITQGLPYEKQASVCKAWVNDSYRKLLALAHAVMGGMGFMEEHDLQLYFRRAKAAELVFGDADFHRDLVARHMGL